MPPPLSTGTPVGVSTMVSDALGPTVSGVFSNSVFFGEGVSLSLFTEGGVSDLARFPPTLRSSGCSLNFSLALDDTGDSALSSVTVRSSACSSFGKEADIGGLAGEGRSFEAASSAVGGETLVKLSIEFMVGVESPAGDGFPTLLVGEGELSWEFCRAKLWYASIVSLELNFNSSSLCGNSKGLARKPGAGPVGGKMDG